MSHVVPEDQKVYGYCRHCGAVEVALTKQDGTVDLSWMGEDELYPAGYGCELCD